MPLSTTTRPNGTMNEEIDLEQHLKDAKNALLQCEKHTKRTNKTIAFIEQIYELSSLDLENALLDITRKLKIAAKRHRLLKRHRKLILSAFAS